MIFEVTLYEIVAMVMFTFIIGGLGFTIGESFGKGGSFRDWIDSFFE